MSGLVLLRHGESTANADDVFAGWLDVPLSGRGRAEARRAAAQLAGLTPDAIHTSVLSRAVETARLLVEEARWPLSPSAYWRLNERHYGALQGLAKADARARFGDAKVQSWRRGVDGRPPRRTTPAWPPSAPIPATLRSPKRRQSPLRAWRMWQHA